MSQAGDEASSSSAQESSSSDEEFAPSYESVSSEEVLPDTSSPTASQPKSKARLKRGAPERRQHSDPESTETPDSDADTVKKRKFVLPQKRKAKKKHLPKCKSGAPASLESLTGNSVYTVVDCTKAEKSKTPAEMRNETCFPGIQNMEHGFSWTDAIPRTEEKPMFTGPTPGPTRSDNDKIINAFSNVASDWINLWMKFTNENGLKILGFSWKIICEEEAAGYFSTLLHMSVHILPQLWMYWDDPDYSSPLVKATISRKRFYEIAKYSKLFSETDASETGQSDPSSDNYDPYYRVNSVWNSFYKTAQEQKNATEDVDVDETVIAFKGRFKGITVNPNKPGNKRRGLRLYNLVDSDGYSHNGMFHSTRKLKFDAKGRFFAILFALLESELLPGGKTFLNLGHKLFCDNLYTEISSMVALKAKKTYYCGTVRIGRSFLPKPILIKRKSQYQGIKFARGDSIFAYSTTHGLLLCNWLDKQHVFVASALPHIKNEIGICTRNQRNRNGKYFNIRLAQPKVVAEYAQKMNFVDRCDQLLDTQRRQTKSNKWTAKVLYHIVHLSCSNALVLHNLTIGSQVSVLDFKKMLINQLRIVSLYNRMPPTVKMENGILKFTGRLPHTILHQFQHGHFSRRTDGRHRCPMHGFQVKRTNNICDSCNTGLCGTNCFLAYHIKLDEQSRF